MLVKSRNKQVISAKIKNTQESETD